MASLRCVLDTVSQMLLIQETGPLVSHVKGSSMSSGNCDLSC